MENLILAVHYFVCFFLIIVILLQAGKGADIGAVFGGGSGTVFGSRGAATFLSKFTTAMAIVFLLTSISLAYFARQDLSKSVIQAPPVEDSSLIAPEPSEDPAVKPTTEAAPKPTAEASAAPIPSGTTEEASVKKEESTPTSEK